MARARGGGYLARMIHPAHVRSLPSPLSAHGFFAAFRCSRARSDFALAVLASASLAACASASASASVARDASTAPAAASAADAFDTAFTGRTLRFDYYHSGNAAEEHI